MNMLANSLKPLIQFGETPLLLTPTAKQLTPESPATSVLTDFTQVIPQSVSADTPIDEAHLKMRHGGVRLLFVIDKANRCIGVLTAKEVIGTRRINLAMQQRNLDRKEITADMIMTPWQKLSAMPIEQLNSLTIEDLVLSMERFTEQHLLITEHNLNQPLSVRGIISATDIQHAVGNKDPMKLSSSAVPTANSFSDICKVVTGHDL
ncbi:CBS domain-containing protein [Vreelandella andesensis]|uniref:CBS domain-containing protein n=1 Tax=Vreelandella andesensis TaxID=447567 RepID=A0A433KKM7_9GAMM|nr:CBS domain-containing protein [Halomonas andesensis]RUR30141.1 CBS domain-containing protein [Halomonas andesensis]